ncbi:Na(+)/H(+) antiporter subunit D [Methanoculleus sp. FWC-SCC1]|uniref:Na(+)/H(+) antiporter subunit D n=1 Tax=Methanoculleus frigidifontis TaxID=2584085 RepID=A0ABT8M837_9EURY|nr:Na(+)/H(+) antiporter subunit D [Methanoculleus sp. FWC-SCC1]MDN7024098.1 Na(+)/H(+) antiporter subunit D [Methanoculleus sp. FWC-SCC1]
MIGIPPAFIFIIGALLVPLVTGRARPPYLAAVGLIGLAATLLISPQTSWVVGLLPEFDLVLLHADGLSLLAGGVFAFAGLLALIYAGRLPSTAHHTAALLYMGGALGVVFAGDFFTVFFFWEIMAIASLVLIWFGGYPRSADAGFRYILLHIFGGSCLLGGIAIQYAATGSIAVGPVDAGAGYMLMLIGIGVNAAFIPLHTWVPDAYPEATIYGSVFLSIFTTKAAIYLLARTFPGLEALAYMGALMVVYGAVFALFQNDIRRILSYSIVSQVGYMVAGIGIGTAIGLSAGAAHLVNDILFKALLFMGMGAVILSTGKSNLTELGGLARKMPITAAFCIIGAAAAAGIPGLNGFVSKGMVTEAAHAAHLDPLSLVLAGSSLITLVYMARLIYYTFFARNDAISAEEAPFPMLAAMGGTAAACIIIGVFPGLLLAVLPFAEHYDPFSLGHLLESGAVILGAAVLFVLGRRALAPRTWVLSDVDILYRRAGTGFVWFCQTPLPGFADAIGTVQQAIIDRLAWFTQNPVDATKLIGGWIVLPVAKVFLPEESVRDFEEDLMKTQEKYPGDPARLRSTGYGIFLASLFFLFYFVIFYLTV